MTDIIDVERKTAEEIKKLRPEALQAYAEEQSIIIVQKIESTISEIESIKDISFNSDKESNWDKFWNLIETGKSKDTRDKEKIIAQLDMFKNKSADGMLKLISIIQESVKFSCTSIEFAQSMNKAMAAMMANGFKDTHGNIRELDDETRKFANYILDQADSFVSNQKDFDLRMNELNSLYDALKKDTSEQREIIEKLEKRTDENKEKIDAQQDKNRDYEVEFKRQAEKYNQHERALEKQIEKDKEHDQLLKEQAEKDKEHDQQLKEQVEKDKEHDQRLNEQVEKDKEHDLQLKEQVEKDKEHDQRLKEQEEKILELEQLLSNQSDKINALEKKNDLMNSKNRWFFIGMILVQVVVIIYLIMNSF